MASSIFRHVEHPWEQLLLFPGYFVYGLMGDGKTVPCSQPVRCPYHMVRPLYWRPPTGTELQAEVWSETSIMADIQKGISPSFPRSANPTATNSILRYPHAPPPSQFSHQRIIRIRWYCTELEKQQLETYHRLRGRGFTERTFKKAIKSGIWGSLSTYQQIEKHRGPWHHPLYPLLNTAPNRHPCYKW